MKAKLLVYALPALVLATIHLAQAQQPKEVPHIGYLTSYGRASFEAFATALRQLGYVEGKSVILEFRTTENTAQLQPELAAELVQLKVDAIVAVGAGAIRAAKNATSTIPIVMSEVNDPIVLGFVASLAHPGGNATGVNSFISEVNAKRLGLLRELLPTTARLAVLVNPANTTNTSSVLADVEPAARALGLQLQIYNASTNREIDAAFAALVRERVEALFVAPDALFSGRRVQLISLAARHALPASYSAREYVEAGGLMSYGTSFADQYRQLGVYAGRILKGASPAELPVVQSTKFELSINLQAARILGLTVPPTLLSIADEVIE